MYVLLIEHGCCSPLRTHWGANRADQAVGAEMMHVIVEDLSGFPREQGCGLGDDGRTADQA